VAEQLFILPVDQQGVPQAPGSRFLDYQVIIVPKAATGFSPIKRPYPQIVSFNWPRRKADGELKGKVGEKADPKHDTYLSVFKRVMNSQLAPFSKAVVDLANNLEEGEFYCNTILEYTRECGTSVNRDHG